MKTTALGEEAVLHTYYISSQGDEEAETRISRIKDTFVVQKGKYIPVMDFTASHATAGFDRTLQKIGSRFTVSVSMAIRCSLLLWVTCLLAVHQAVAEGKKEAVLRDSGWKLHGSREFKFFGLKTTWDEAEKNCVRHNAHLASVHDEGEDGFIKRLIHTQSNNNQPTWLGGYNSRTAHERWYWTDGSEFDFADWFPGEPNGSGHCLQTNYYGAWDDLVCSYQRAFVCARKAKMVGSKA
ncbi:hypothetical protein AOLI_G00211680 [Acnodon oligacanthus]